MFALLLPLFFIITKSGFVPALSPAIPSCSLPFALYGTITFFVLKDLIVPSTLFYNIPTVFLGKKNIYLRKYDISSSINCSDAVPGITAGTTMGWTARI